jgi:hypothetical protein
MDDQAKRTFIAGDNVVECGLMSVVALADLPATLSRSLEPFQRLLRGPNQSPTRRQYRVR